MDREKDSSDVLMNALAGTDDARTRCSGRRSGPPFQLTFASINDECRFAQQETVAPYSVMRIVMMDEGLEPAARGAPNAVKAPVVALIV